MPITISETGAQFEGDCTVEEALALSEYLSREQAPRIDLGPCTYLHTSLLQLLLRTRHELVRAPEAPRLAALLPHLIAAQGAWIATERA